MTILQLKDVRHHYPSGFEMKDLDLEVDRGAFVSLIGPNGSGKSTVIKLLSGLLRPDQGSVLLKGIPVQDYRAKELAAVLSVIPSENFFEFPFRVREVVEMGRFPHLRRLGRLSRHDHEIVDRALESTETAALAVRPISELSSGERQRVLMARALAQEPSVLLLDEPNAHLDIRHQLSIFQLIRDLSRDKAVTVVAVLHDLAMAAAYSDVVVVINQGRIQDQGPPQQIISESMIRHTYGASVRIHHSREGWPLIDYKGEEPSGGRG